LNDRKLMATGIIGTVITALCCFTPVLGILLGVVGLSVVLGYLDYVLIPAMLVFVGITIYAVLKHRKHA
jgi:mercuric ion transport protein